MDASSRNAIAAAIFVIGFGLVAYFMPTIMLAVGSYSTIAAGFVAVAFVAYQLRSLNRSRAAAMRAQWAARPVTAPR